MSELLRNDVEGGYPNLMGLFRNDDYKVYAKTGTTNWGSEGAQFDIPSGSIKDGWVVGCTSEYSVATWMGYEKGQVGKPSYMTYDLYNKNIKGKITKLILDETAEKFGYPEDIARPSGITSITHIAKVGTPYVAPIEGIDEKYLTSGLIMSKSPLASLSSPQKATISDLPEEPKITINGTKLSITWPKYPDEKLLEVADETIDLVLNKSDGETLFATKGNRMFDYTWVFGAVKYKADISVGGKLIKSITSGDNEELIDLTGEITSDSKKVTACAYYGYENANVNSASKCKEVEINDTVTVNLSADLNTLKSTLSNYGTVEVEKKAATSDHKKGTFELFVYDPSERNLTNDLGSSKELHSLSIKKFVIVEYTDATITLQITSTPSVTGGVSANSKITFEANVTLSDGSTYDDKYDWDITGNAVDGVANGNKFTVTIIENCTVSVELEDGTSAEIEVKINN